MNLANIKPMDIVRAEVSGRSYFALFVRKTGRSTAEVDPISHNVSYYNLEAHEIKEHWARKGGRKKR